METSESNIQRLDGISILRLFACLIVVAFHCYGMMYAGHFPDSKDMYHDVYFFLNQCFFINIAMPLFIFVSGYLFEFLLCKGKYATWKNLLLKKSQRILLPYFVFGLFFMVTTGHIRSCLDLFYGNFWHLWFLPMLFWCFVLGKAVHYIKPLWGRALLLFFFYALLLLNVNLPQWMGIQFIPDWFYWFYLGQIVFEYRGGQVKRFCDQYQLQWITLLAGLCVMWLFPAEYGHAPRWFDILAQSLVTISLCRIANSIEWNKFNFTGKLMKISDYSYGLYIFHNWVAFLMISRTSKRIFHLEPLAADHVVLFPLCFFLLTLAVSLLFTVVLKKTKIGGLIL